MTDNFDDKYPADSSRRRFVRGVVGSAALAGVGTASATIIDTATTPPGFGGGPTTYRGAEQVGGPAPRGLPQIPIEVDDDGYVIGIWPELREVEVDGRTVVVAEMDLAGETYESLWFQYCGIQSAPGIVPDADHDNFLHYTRSSNYDWQTEEKEGGERLHISDFDDYRDHAEPIGTPGLGKAAQARWRSEGEAPRDVIPVQVIRSHLVEEAAENDDWLSASTDQGFIAFLNQCTHFCCVPGWKTYRDAPQFNAEDKIYCQCHQSVFDPFSIVTETFFSLPRPGDR